MALRLHLQRQDDKEFEFLASGRGGRFLIPATHLLILYLSVRHSPSASRAPKVQNWPDGTTEEQVDSKCTEKMKKKM